jgi:putative two-component system response regulator
MILIIDDEAGLRRSLSAHLEDRNFDTLEAANGQEGLDLLKANREHIEAVVVDLNMPVMDGYSFIKHALPLAPETPIIVLSGVGVVEDALSAIRAGAWDFITKPLHNMDILDHTLGKVFERARLIRENRQY